MEAAVKGPGWGVGEEVLRLLPGPSFEVEQTSDDKGLPIEKPAQDRKLTGLCREEDSRGICYTYNHMHRIGLQLLLPRKAEHVLMPQV